ncbi:hypothetical protein [Kribbella speibonae]|uniref:ESX-1 secretion-associated protein n=1 Tax=Kribbella speibonae TaxID=1572660 RepID=A0ABY2AEI2_9ACTN|nr:hypothetical protein [Kribbella speibonae]TCC28089.1 hypothetical protein E0H58_09245 [Kribbella speibonae]
MSDDLAFSSPELYQFSKDAGSIKIPSFADDGGGDLRGGVRGSEAAADSYGKVAAAAEFYLDRARRGLQAFEQLSSDIAQRFDGQDHVNATEFKNAWDPEHQQLRGNRSQDMPPPLPPARPGETVPTFEQLMLGNTR